MSYIDDEAYIEDLRARIAALLDRFAIRKAGELL